LELLVWTISFTYWMPQPKADRMTIHKQLLALVFVVACTISVSA
jgi:hypothetical protein